MKTSQKGINLIKEFEGYRSKAYKDSAGVWTIGYGHTGDVAPGDIISAHQGEVLLTKDLEWAEKAITDLVKVPLNQNQFDALVSFVYNVGKGAFRKSTLLKKLNEKQYILASNEFKRWVYAGGKKLKGLQRRREAEKKLFISMVELEEHRVEEKQDLSWEDLFMKIINKILGR